MKYIKLTGFMLLLLVHSLVSERVRAQDIKQMPAGYIPPDNLNCIRECKYHPQQNQMSCPSISDEDAAKHPEETYCIVTGVDLLCGANRNCRTSGGFSQGCESKGACISQIPTPCYWPIKGGDIGTMDANCNFIAKDGYHQIYLGIANLPSWVGEYAKNITPIKSNASLKLQHGGERDIYNRGLGIFYN